MMLKYSFKKIVYISYNFCIRHKRISSVDEAMNRCECVVEHIYQIFFFIYIYFLNIGSQFNPNRAIYVIRTRDLI